jgi:hypothetical protein
MVYDVGFMTQVLTHERQSESRGPYLSVDTSPSASTDVGNAEDRIYRTLRRRDTWTGTVDASACATQPAAGWLQSRYELAYYSSTQPQLEGRSPSRADYGSRAERRTRSIHPHRPRLEHDTLIPVTGRSKKWIGIAPASALARDLHDIIFSRSSTGCRARLALSIVSHRSEACLPRF